MKRLTIQFHKACSNCGGHIITKVIQEVDVIKGEPPLNGAFFEPGFEKFFNCFLSIEGYLLAFMDNNMEDWKKSAPGLLTSISLDENDFNGEQLDEEIFLKIMTADAPPVLKNSTDSEK